MSNLPEHDEERNTGAAGQNGPTPANSESLTGNAPGDANEAGTAAGQAAAAATSGEAGEPPVLPDSSEVRTIVDSLRHTPLADNHLADLRTSGLTDETIRTAGLCSAPAAATGLLGFHNSSAIVFPYLEHPGYIRIKPDQPRIDREGKAIKYESPRGSRNHLYVPHQTRARLHGMGEPVTAIIITEGEKKALKADQEGFATISTPGVSGWQTCVPELTGIGWTGRRAIIVFDSDVTRKPGVKVAISALTDRLRDDGANARVALLPDLEGREKTGLDDYLVARGAESLQQLLDGAKSWFGTLLDMLTAGLAADALEATLQPMYEQIANAGVVGGQMLLEQLRARLRTLGYPNIAKDDMQRAVRACAAHRGRRGYRAGDHLAENEPAIRFVAEGPEGRFARQPEKYGLYDMRFEEPQQLTNFVMRITEDVHVADDLHPRRVFRGTIALLGVERPFTIDAEDYGNNGKLIAAIYATAGAKAEFHCKLETLRTVVSAVSGPVMRHASTNFGWNADKTVYMVPGGQITAGGFQTADQSAAQVDLADQEFAKRLSLRPIPADQLLATKRHIVDDLLQLCPDAKVGYALLAGAALSVLYRFTDGMNRVLLWVVGLSGNGKSFMAKLFQNLFGDFPIAGEKSVISWASTVKRIQHEGYYFRDAMFLADDYKPEHCRPVDATWLLQAYADSAARSRLRSDATAAETREIRGLLVCTGEDVPDHSASATARLIKVPYPMGEKNLDRGRRCQQQRVNYAGVMCDFIRHIIANNRGAAFATRVAELQQRYYREVTGSDNDLRIAGNFAMLAAAFEEIADYLRDAWQGADEAKRVFLEQHVPELRQATLADVSDQKASRLFLSTLAVLVQQGAVRINGHVPGMQPQPNATLIGRAVQAEEHHRQDTQGPAPAEAAAAPAVGRRGAVSHRQEDTALEIWTSATLGVVQQALRQQGKPVIAVSEKGLLQQLREDGVLLGRDNQPLPREGSEDATRQVRIGEVNRKAFRILYRTLMQGWL
jgi:hypothetical protein